MHFPNRSLRMAVGVPVLLLVPVALLFAVLHWGGDVTARAALPLPGAPVAATAGTRPDVFLVILQICVVLLAARGAGVLFRLIGQPRVVGEMAAGIALGPSLLGWVAPALSKAVFPASSLDYMNILSQVGLVLFMFLIGLEINPKDMKGLGRAAVLVSHASVSVPFVLGSGLAIYLYPRFSDRSVGFLSFAVFIGAAMSITAFPVLARILTERNLLRTRMGTLAIACAAVNDVTGWCILAAVMMLYRVRGSPSNLWFTIGGSAAFAVFVVVVLRPMLRGFEASFRRKGALDHGAIAMLIFLVLGSALITERLGVHLLFGAFLLGTVMPKDEEFVRHIMERFEAVTVVFLLPLFFAYSGLRTDIGLLRGGNLWLDCLLVTAIAVAGKAGGSAVAARLAGMDWREAAGVGILMNTRGLMELIILNIGLDIRVISPGLFSVMVIMALSTTVMTTPLLNWVCAGRLRREVLHTGRG